MGKKQKTSKTEDLLSTYLEMPDNPLEPGLSPIIRFTRVYDACFKR